MRGSESLSAPLILFSTAEMLNYGLLFLLLFSIFLPYWVYLLFKLDEWKDPFVHPQAKLEYSLKFKHKG